MKLFPYQDTGARWLASKDQALLADDMGLGKSAQAVRACDLVGAKNILVICPAAVRFNWAREFERFSPMDRPTCLMLTSRDRPASKSGVVICSYDLSVGALGLLKTIPWDVLILDEAHYLKERTTKRTRAAYGHNKATTGLAAHAKRTWRLTGTPAPNDASELYTHLRSAGIVNEPFWDFTFRFCKGFDSTYGYKITGHKNVEELKALLAPFMLRRTKDEVMTELPPIWYQEVTVDRSQVELDGLFPEAQEVGAAAFVANLRVGEVTLKQALEAASGPTDAMSVLEGSTTSLTTLRRYIAMGKVPAVANLLAEELESGAVRKVVVFGVHKCAVEYMEQHLAKFGAVSLYGSTPPAKRQANIDRFMQDPECRVFIGNVQAAGTGITLTAAHEVVFLEQSWVPAENAQAAMRCHRIGQTKPVRVRVFSLYKSVDEQVQQVLLRKAQELSKIF